MVVGCSYSSGANFTAGNDVEPGMFCGQAAARGATYRLCRGSEVTNLFCRFFQIGMSARQETLAEAKGGSSRLFSAYSHSMRKPTGDGCGEVAKQQGVQFCQVINAMIAH